MASKKESKNKENGPNDLVLQRALNYLERSEISAANKKTINALVNYLAAQDLVKVRQSKYIYTTMQLSRRIENKDFSTLTQKDIEELVASINNSSKFSEWTKRDYRIILRRLIKFIREKQGQRFLKGQYPEEVAWIPSTMKKARKKLPSELLSIDDVKNLAEGTFNLRDKAFILFLYESGARIGEVLNIKLKDVDFDKYGARISLFGKTGDRKVRIIASAPAISNWLKQHPERNNKDGWLFCSINHASSGAQGEYRYFNKLLKVASGRVGLKKPVNPHHFRHSRASELAKKLPESLLCQYFGWEIGSREVRTYVHLSGRDSDKAILALHGLTEEEKPEDQFTPVLCPRCGLKNDPGAKFCSGCSLGLDLKTVMDYETAKDELITGGVNIFNEDGSMKKEAEQIIYQLVKLLKNKNADKVSLKQ